MTDESDRWNLFVLFSLKQENHTNFSHTTYTHTLTILYTNYQYYIFFVQIEKQRFEGGPHEKKEGKRGKKEKEEKSDKTRVIIPLWSLNDRKKIQKNREKL